MSTTAYDALSASDQALVDEACLLGRPVAGVTSKLLNSLRAAKTAMDLAQSVIDTLADADELPNKTGLSGAMNLTVAEYEELKGDIAAAIATFDTTAKRELRAKAAGSNNTLGTI